MPFLCIKAAVVGLLVGLLGQVCPATPVVIDNASFENATGYRAETTAPSSWLYALTNLTDSSGSTAGDSYIEQASTSSAPGVDGANCLILTMEVGATAISGKTVTCWVSTQSLGTYQANSIYTLTVAQTAHTGETNRSGGIALAADGAIVVSQFTSFSQLNALGEVFQDKQVVVDTVVHPEVVGKTISVQLLQQAADGARYSRYALFDNVRLDVADAPMIDIQNASFENAVGYRAEGTAPSSWLISLANLTDTSGSTTGESYVEQVSDGVATHKDGNNMLALMLEVGATPISGKTVTCWVSTNTLGVYEADHLYTLIVGQTSLTSETNRTATIALAADSQIVAGTSTPFSVLNPTGTPEGRVFQDKQVVLNTLDHPEVVGKAISVQLLQNATDQARYLRTALFDNVRLESLLIDPYSGGGGSGSGGGPTPQPRMGMNLGGAGAAEPFADLFRIAGAWISQRPGTPWNSGPALDLDAHGWVKSLEPGCYVQAELGVFSGGGHYPSGQYTILYDGEGTFAFWPTSVASIVDASQPGRIVLQVNATDPFFLQINSINPANYPRNIRVILPGYESTWQTNPWRSDFLQRWAGVACFRFMDWQWTNNSTVLHWNDRPTPDDATNAIHHGTPLETMIDLCNRQHANPWFCMPHQADDDYVQQFATMVKNNLDPTLKVYIEYSNEVWNSGFTQHTYAMQKADELNLGEQTRLWEGACIYYAQRSVQIFKIWEQVFGGKDRLVRVLAWQAAADANYWLDTLLLAGTQPGDVDALAVAPYMAFNIPATSSDPNSPGADVVATWTVDQVLDFVEQHSLPDSISWMNNTKGVANKYGIQLIAYEAGQHLVGVGGGENNTTVTNLLHEANAHSRMGTLYTSYFAAWQTAGGDLMCIFADMNPWSKWGSWGLLQYTDDDPLASPKFMATMQWAQSLGQPVNVPSSPP